MGNQVFIWNWCEWGTWGTENEGDNLCGVDELRIMKKAQRVKSDLSAYI